MPAVLTERGASGGGLKIAGLRSVLIAKRDCYVSEISVNTMLLSYVCHGFACMCNASGKEIFTSATLASSSVMELAATATCVGVDAAGGAGVWGAEDGCSSESNSAMSCPGSTDGESMMDLNLV